LQADALPTHESESLVRVPRYREVAGEPFLASAPCPLWVDTVEKGLVVLTE